MRISTTGPGISVKRIRDLADAHDRAWSQRARFLRQSTDISVPCEGLTQKANAPLLALLTEGISEGQWVAAPRGECVLVEREGDELVQRRAPREMVEAAPECSGPKSDCNTEKLRAVERVDKVVLGGPLFAMGCLIAAINGRGSLEGEPDSYLKLEIDELIELLMKRGKAKRDGLFAAMHACRADSRYV